MEPWKHGSTYFVVLVNNRQSDDFVLIFFDAANEDRDSRFVGTLQDANVKKAMKDLAAVAVENAPMGAFSSMKRQV